MGQDVYNSNNRSLRAASSGYATKSVNQIFEQAAKRRIHESMDPRKIRLREARDSSVHPNSYPIIFYMDVTGSMDKVPMMLIKDGLPKMVTTIIEKGIESPAILFLAIGDSKGGDNAPLQVGQFESGDLELDTWLTRTYPEGGGHGNGGESYLWSWYFAAFHCQTDAFDKRGEKGLLIGFGDEPFHPQIGKHEYEEVMGTDNLPSGLEFPLTAEFLLKKAQERWDVYHIHFADHGATPQGWKNILKENLIEVEDYTEVPNAVARIAVQNCSYRGKGKPRPAGDGTPTTDDGSSKKDDFQIIL